MIPLGIAVLIVNTAPLWTSVLAYLFNGEPIYRKEYVSMAVCFIGMIGITFGGRHEEK
jgi:drug/metabolite transporter (DMT)-like permease